MGTEDGDVELQTSNILLLFSSRRRHTRYIGDWSSDVCSSDLRAPDEQLVRRARLGVDQRAEPLRRLREAAARVLEVADAQLETRRRRGRTPEQALAGLGREEVEPRRIDG